MEAPQSLINLVSSTLTAYKCQLRYLGKYKNREAFCLSFDEPVHIGFPEVYLCSEDSIETITEPLSFEIIRLFSKN